MNSLARVYQENRAAVWIIAAFTAVRLAVAPTFGLGTDEAHYALYARFLDLSYFDHPPLVGWTHALFFYTLGTNEFLVRLPAILLFVFTSFLCYRFDRSFAAERPALLALAALNSSFLLGGLGLMLLPESLLLPLAYLLIFAVLRLERTPSTANFALLGLVLGLAGLTKYTAILFIPALVVYAVAKKRSDILFDPRMLVAAFIALVLVTPVLFWNLQNGFASFRYQSGHVAGGHAPDLKLLFGSLGAQFGAYSPPLFCLAFYGLYRAFRDRRAGALLPALLGVTLLLFFLYSALYRFSLPHWSAVFYALFIPLGVLYLDQAGLRWKKGILIFSLGLTILIALLVQAELAVKAFRFPDYQSPFRSVYRLADVLKRANEILAQDPSAHKALAVSNWTEVSRTMYYDMPYTSTVFLIPARDERYAHWITGSPLGADLLFLNNHFHRTDLGREVLCRETRKAGSMDITLHGGKVDTVDFEWCRSFGGMRVP